MTRVWTAVDNASRVPTAAHTRLDNPSGYPHAHTTTATTFRYTFEEQEKDRSNLQHVLDTT